MKFISVSTMGISFGAMLGTGPPSTEGKVLTVEQEKPLLVHNVEHTAFLAQTLIIILCFRVRTSLCVVGINHTGNENSLEKQKSKEHLADDHFCQNLHSSQAFMFDL